jgi:hypothetical protein
MKRETISAKGLLELIFASDQEEFDITFIKRSNGEVKSMKCKYGVPSERGGTMRYDPAKKGLIVVYNVEEGGYKTIGVEGIISASINNKNYVVEGMKDKLHRNGDRS